MKKFVIPGLVLGLVLAACQGSGVEPTPSLAASVSPDPSVSPSDDATPDATPETGSPSPTPEPTASPTTAIPLDTVVATTVEELSVRRDPGTDGERLGFLELGTVAFVMAGPTEVNGVPWYRISGMGLPYASGCATTPPDQPISCPAFQGWVAAANQAGDPWLEQADPPDCPAPTITSISESGYTLRLVCWADDEVTFDAWWPEIPPDAGLGGYCPEGDEPAGFLFCQHINYNGLVASPEEGFVARLGLSIDPASGITMPERGQWITVTGGFDHPAADACADLVSPDQDPIAVAFGCRLEFVPTSVQPRGS